MIHLFRLADSRPGPIGESWSLERTPRQADVVLQDRGRDSARTPGAVITISRKDQLAYFEAVGYGDPATKAPMQADVVGSRRKVSAAARTGMTCPASSDYG